MGLSSVKLGLWLGSVSGWIQPRRKRVVSLRLSFWRGRWDWSSGVSALEGLGDLGSVMQVSALFS